MQNGPKFLVAATFEKANTYDFAKDVIHNPKVKLTCRLSAFANLGELSISWTYASNVFLAQVQSLCASTPETQHV